MKPPKSMFKPIRVRYWGMDFGGVGANPDQVIYIPEQVKEDETPTDDAVSATQTGLAELHAVSPARTPTEGGVVPG